MIWIDHNVPSLKNSKVKTSRGIFMSKTVKKYLQKLGIAKYSSSRKEVIDYKTKENLFTPIADKLKEELKNKKYPYKIGFHFVRGSRHSFDFHNAVQILADLMVAYDVLEDDDMNHFIPVPFKINGNYYSYDKEKPGVYIKIY